MTKELSIFIDESGDFGPYSPKSPFYLVTLVLHEQSVFINKNVQALDTRLQYYGFPQHVIHTGPLIRRESIYSDMGIVDRKHLFLALFHFVRLAPIHYTTIKAKKQVLNSKDSLATKIAEGIISFIDTHKGYLSSFERIIIYYDNGQVELTKVLKSIMQDKFPNAAFRLVKPSEYRLFQAADLICTVELLNIKADNNTFSKSEKALFGTPKDFRKNIYRYISKKRL